MTEKDVVLALKTYKDIKFLIEDKNKELTNVLKQKYELCEPRATLISGMPKSQKVNDSTFHNVCEIIFHFEEEIERLSKELKNLILQKNNIEININKLLPLEQKLIKLRYFERKKWFQIEQQLNYSQRQPFYMHNKIIHFLAQNWE